MGELFTRGASIWPPMRPPTAPMAIDAILPRFSLKCSSVKPAQPRALPASSHMTMFMSYLQEKTDGRGHVLKDRWRTAQPRADDSYFWNTTHHTGRSLAGQGISGKALCGRRIPHVIASEEVLSRTTGYAQP